MDKQQIKEAAAKASEDYMENTLIMSGPRGSYRKGFIAGSNWRINSVWHDARVEIPDRLRLILVEKDDEKFTLNIANGKMSSCPMFWVRWAYISDLLPERKEEING